MLIPLAIQFSRLNLKKTA